MKKRVRTTAEFKAKCLAYLDEVERVGGQIKALRPMSLLEKGASCEPR